MIKICEINKVKIYQVRSMAGVIGYATRRRGSYGLIHHSSLEDAEKWIKLHHPCKVKK